MDEAVLTPTAEKSKAPKPREGWFFNPYVQLLLSIILSAAAQIFMKLGSSGISEMWLGFEGLRSGWMWLGFAAMVGSLFFWLYGLKYVPLNIAYNLAGLVQVLVPVASWLFLGEKIGLLRGSGILLVCAGVFVVARPLMRMEESL
ncbi:MAG TPA: EamA family transporter [Chthoniobacteraceae bacterium]|jgi:drug/metabolite transporter (DMT)-like permease|nr:EamA family transporter [Chthoniobacteraceae bacterium]